MCRWPYETACNDVNLCLRLGERGLRTIFTPHAELFHQESATRGSDIAPEKAARGAQESALIRRHWG